MNAQHSMQTVIEQILANPGCYGTALLRMRESDPAAESAFHFQLTSQLREIAGSSSDLELQLLWVQNIFNESDRGD